MIDAEKTTALTANGRATKLLWTGGWDSTYRLLVLVRVNGQFVQPYYIIDHDRHSFANEMQAMVRIRKAIYERWPETRGLILPTVFTAREDIAPHDEVTRRYENLEQEFRRRYRTGMGSQNEWLARFAEERGLRGLEMCIHNTPQNTGYYAALLRDCLTTGGDRIALKQDVRGDRELFKYFHFPLFHMCKLDMQREAERYGFAGILEETWFCFSPRDDRPCGRCNPCMYTMRQGLYRRIPFFRRFRYYLIRRPLRALKKNRRIREVARWLLRK